MIKKKWYDIFGWLYRRDTENEQLKLALESVKKQLEENNGTILRQQLAMLQHENATLKEAVESRQKRLDAIAGFQRQGKVSEKRSVGRPRIDSVPINFHLDLDTNLVVDTLLAATGEKKTRFLNSIIRTWLLENHGELYENLKKNNHD